MAKWRVDLNKGGMVGKTSAGGFSNDTMFYGKSKGKEVEVDFSKPITKNGQNVNVANIVGIGAKHLEMTISKDYLRYVPSGWVIGLGVVGVLGLLGLAVYHLKND